MGKVVVDISMSLDGVATAPGADLEHGLEVGGGKGMRAQGRLPGRDAPLVQAAVLGRPSRPSGDVCKAARESPCVCVPSRER
jgi:hypothetical protein